MNNIMNPITIIPEVVVTPDMTTEQTLLEMSDHFKTLVECKNAKLERLTKTVLKVYGLVEAMAEMSDFSYIPVIQNLLEADIMYFCHLE